MEQVAEILQSPNALRVLDVYGSVDRVSHVAIIILLFPAGLEDKLGVDASWHGAHSASWSLALSYPRFGAPGCSFSFGSFGRIVVCPEGKRVSAGRGRALEVVNDSVFPAVVVRVILATLLTSPLLKLANSSQSLP
jgi:hypothetical protein